MGEISDNHSGQHQIQKKKSCDEGYPLHSSLLFPYFTGNHEVNHMCILSNPGIPRTQSWFMYLMRLSVHEIEACEMKVTKQYFPLLLFIIFNYLRWL